MYDMTDCIIKRIASPIYEISVTLNEDDKP